MFYRLGQRGDQYQHRAQRNLHDVANRFWLTETSAQLLNATIRPPKGWSILVTSEEAVADDRSTLATFVSANPGIVVGIERTSSDGGSADATFNGTWLVQPEDLDGWIQMMRSLINTARQAHRD
jgi:hypothetical protein